MMAARVRAVLRPSSAALHGLSERVAWRIHMCSWRGCSPPLETGGVHFQAASTSATYPSEAQRGRDPSAPISGPGRLLWTGMSNEESKALKRLDQLTGHKG